MNLDATYDSLARPTGTFAMVAIDQRESLRSLLADGTGRVVTDDDLVRFKVDVARLLSPFASALLVDEPYGLGPIRDAGALQGSCGLIVAADRLMQQAGGVVEGTSLDTSSAIAGVNAGAAALKLLVLWFPHAGVQERQLLVSEFIELCRRHGTMAIVEGVVRPAPSGLHTAGDPWLAEDGIVEAAAELCAAGPDLYKCEVPTHGTAEPGQIESLARDVTHAVGRPWVVLSQGVAPERFASAVEAAAKGGASGFLAGRAIWAPALRTPDPLDYLTNESTAVLVELGAIVDRFARPWRRALG